MTELDDHQPVHDRPVAASSTATELAAEEIAVACRRLHARGLLAGAEGNVSVRLANGDLLITPAGADKSTITAADIVLVIAGDPGAYEREPHLQQREPGVPSDIARRPSSELGMHLVCYAGRSDVHAVVHAHPPAATGFAVAGVGLPANVLPELPVVLGAVAMVPYARPGTAALGEALRPFLSRHDVFLLANHGVVTVAATVHDAVLRMETVEQAARILLFARLLGGERTLAAEESAALALLRGTS